MKQNYLHVCGNKLKLNCDRETIGNIDLCITIMTNNTALQTKINGIGSIQKYLISAGIESMGTQLENKKEIIEKAFQTAENEPLTFLQFFARICKN